MILARGLSSAAFFGTGVFLPYLFTERYRFTPATAGIALSAGAIAWAVGSAVQGRRGPRLEHRRAAVIGFALLLVAIAIVLTAVALDWSAIVVIAAWLLAGGGMGLQFPRMTIMALALSTDENKGFNTSALSIAHSLGAALALSVSGMVFAGGSFFGVFVVAAVFAAAGLLVAARITAACPRWSAGAARE